MFLKVLPLQALDMKFSRRKSPKHPAEFVADGKNGKDGNGRVDPGAGNAGELVKAEDQSGDYCKGGVKAEKRGEADEDTHCETSGDVSWVAIQ